MSTELASLVRRFEHGSRVPGWDEAADLAKDPAVVPDRATTPVPEALATLIEDHMTRYPDRRSASLPALRAAQRHHGWLSPTAIEQVGAVMRLTPGYLVAVATFYDMFEHAPVGRNTIYVCTNISCSLRGADRVYEALLDAAGDDGDFNIRAFECLGACDIAPMASVNSVYVGPLSLDECPTLIQQLRDGEEPLPAKRLTQAPIARTWWASGEHPVGEPAGGAGAEGLTAIENEPGQE
ncbi:MAG: NAD(P)H-dependent oxidoreductase subunit E [Solirubrobacteraceae bacterium]